MSNKSKKDNTCCFVVVAVIIVFLLFSANWFFLHGDQNRGTIGDMFGCANALFSGLAFVGVIYAILLQRKELEYQRNELEQTREELKGQKEQMQTQNDTLKKQNFENTIFQLLSLHNEIIHNMEIPRSGDENVKGRNCFSRLFLIFNNQWEKDRHRKVDCDVMDKINVTYLTFYSNNESILGHYFQSLYYILFSAQKVYRNA